MTLGQRRRSVAFFLFPCVAYFVLQYFFVALTLGGMNLLIGIPGALRWLSPYGSTKKWCIEPVPTSASLEPGFGKLSRWAAFHLRGKRAPRQTPIGSSGSRFIWMG